MSTNQNQNVNFNPFNQPRIHVASADDIVFYSTHRVYLFEYSFEPLLKYVNTNEIPASNEILSLHYKSDELSLTDGCAFPSFPFIAVLGDGTRSELSRRIIRIFDYFTGALILKYKYSHQVLGVRSIGNLILTILHNKIIIQALPLGPNNNNPNHNLTAHSTDPTYGITQQQTQSVLPMEPRTVPTASNVLGIYAVHDAAAHSFILSQFSQFRLPANITSLIDRFTFSSNLPSSPVVHSFVCFPQLPPQNAQDDPVIQGYKGFVGILDLVTLQHTKTIPVCKGIIQHLQLSPDGHLLAVASDKGTLIRVFNTTTGGLMHTFRRGHNPATICSMAFSFHNELLVVSSLNSKVIHVFKLSLDQFNDDSINLLSNDNIGIEELDLEDERAYNQSAKLDLDGFEPELLSNTQVPPIQPTQQTTTTVNSIPSTSSQTSSWTKYFSWGNFAAATSTATTYASSLVSAGANAITNVVGMVEPPRHYGYAIVNHVSGPTSSITSATGSSRGSPQLQPQNSSPPLNPSTSSHNNGNNAFSSTISAIGSYLPNSISGYYNDTDIYIADLRVYCIYSHTPSNEINTNQSNQRHNAESLLTVCGYFVLAFCTNGSVYVYRGGKGQMKLIKEELFLPPEIDLQLQQQQQQLQQQRRQSLQPSSSPSTPPLNNIQTPNVQDQINNHNNQSSDQQTPQDEDDNIDPKEYVNLPPPKYRFAIPPQRLIRLPFQHSIRQNLGSPLVYLNAHNFNFPDYSLLYDFQNKESLLDWQVVNDAELNGTSEATIAWGSAKNPITGEPMRTLVFQGRLGNIILPNSYIKQQNNKAGSFFNMVNERFNRSKTIQDSHGKLIQTVAQDPSVDFGDNDDTNPSNPYNEFDYGSVHGFVGLMSPTFYPPLDLSPWNTLNMCVRTDGGPWLGTVKPASLTGNELYMAGIPGADGTIINPRKPTGFIEDWCRV